MSIVSICLVCDTSIVATCPSKPAARFAFRLCFIRFVLLFVVVLSGKPKQNQGQTKTEPRARVSRPQTNSSTPVISLLAVPWRLFCFGSLVILDVACCYLWLYININIGNDSC